VVLNPTMKTLMKIQIALGLILAFSLSQCRRPAQELRSIVDFTGEWEFYLDPDDASPETLPGDSAWRMLDLPHDWSIEGDFSKDNPATPGGGALPGGVGWYRKIFDLDEQQKGRKVYVDFDGIYRNSEVWINGHYLGFRPNGYISFRYDLTPYLRFGDIANEILVRVDNSMQPNSRWYSGSGIYRNVRLVITHPVHIDHWGTFVSVYGVRADTAALNIRTDIRNDSGQPATVTLITHILDPSGSETAIEKTEVTVPLDTSATVVQDITLKVARFWSPDAPVLYTSHSEVLLDGIPVDELDTPFGIRTFRFDPAKGFFVNGQALKIRGVCDHHDLGCLGSAVNTRAMERQLEILKAMGCNAIRTSHNPPDPGLLDLCDRMGFLVMDEAFDMWKRGKTRFDYHMYWDEWSHIDLRDQVLRDRNHPSVIIWSIGNEIWEQGDSSGTRIARELTSLIKGLDPTRPVTSALNDPVPNNFIYRSGALDLVGFNYHEEYWKDFPENFPGQCFIASETTSALATRGSYDMPSDSIRVWPKAWYIPFRGGNPDYTCSAYDNCHVPWGSTHEKILRMMEQYDFISGIFVWTGFDYLGEPTPYPWPARSSYFGIVDLAGFPKDAYYLYKSRWTDEPVLHLLPHWNWKEGDTVDVIAYTNLPEVELFLNGESQGIRNLGPEVLHLRWRVPFRPGELKAIGRKEGAEVLETQVRTAGPPARIELAADRNLLACDKKDLSFITVTVTDRDGNPVPDAGNLIRFAVEGPAGIAGVANGYPASHEHFKADFRKCFNGKCLLVIRAGDSPGQVRVTASSASLEPATIHLRTKANPR
jgi:beta-galactosidase